MERSSYTYSSKHSESNIKDFCHLSFCDSLTVTLTTLQAYCSAILNEFFLLLLLLCYFVHLYSILQCILMLGLQNLMFACLTF